MAPVRELAAQAWAGYGCHGGCHFVCHGGCALRRIFFTPVARRRRWRGRSSFQPESSHVLSASCLVDKKPQWAGWGGLNLEAPGRCGRCAEDQELHLRKTDPWSLAQEPLKNWPKNHITRTNCLHNLPQSIPNPIILCSVTVPAKRKFCDPCDPVQLSSTEAGSGGVLRAGE